MRRDATYLNARKGFGLSQGPAVHVRIDFYPLYLHPYSTCRPGGARHCEYSLRCFMLMNVQSAMMPERVSSRDVLQITTWLVIVILTTDLTGSRTTYFRGMWVGRVKKNRLVRNHSINTETKTKTWQMSSQVWLPLEIWQLPGGGVVGRTFVEQA